MASERIIFITGASSGIGAATAVAFARDGATLVLGARRQERLDEVAERARVAGARRVVTLPLDVQAPDSIAAFCREGLAVAGGAHVLVNNAGGAKGTAPIEHARDEDWEYMLDANVLGVLRMTRALLPPLVASGDGHVVMIGSLAGHRAYEGGAAYCGAKAAVRYIRDALRLELCGRPVRVSTVDPGMVDTEFSLVRLGDAEKAKKVYAGMTPLVAEDVADVIHFLATRPPHVNIDEVVMTPRDQAGVGRVHRRAEP